MSNKVEAATGGTTPNTFTDKDGVQFAVTTHKYTGETVINLHAVLDSKGLDATETITFWASDATKIIALIAEAAK